VAAMRNIVLEAMRAGRSASHQHFARALTAPMGCRCPQRLADDKSWRRSWVLARGGARALHADQGRQTRMSFLESLAAESGRPVVVAGCFTAARSPRACSRSRGDRGCQCARPRPRGAVSCCPLSMGFHAALALHLRRARCWQAALPLKGDAYKRKLADPAFRAAVREEIARPAHFRLFNGEWAQGARGRVGAAARRAALDRRARGAGPNDPLDCMLDLRARREPRDGVQRAAAQLRRGGRRAHAARPARAGVALDAGAHLTFFNDSGFGLHLLGHWSRELGVLSLPEAAWRLTGIRRRSTASAAAARCARATRDLLLFDPQTVNRGPNRRVFDLPADQPRLTADAIGVHGVWVNGVRIADSNGLRKSAGLPGRLLRDFAA